MSQDAFGSVPEPQKVHPVDLRLAFLSAAISACSGLTLELMSSGSVSFCGLVDLYNMLASGVSGIEIALPATMRCNVPLDEVSILVLGSMYFLGGTVSMLSLVFNCLETASEARRELRREGGRERHILQRLSEAREKFCVWVEGQIHGLELK